LEKALGLLEKVTAHLFSVAAGGHPELFLADATLYLEFFGIIAIAWQWLLQATAARKALATADQEAEICFYSGKLLPAAIFSDTNFPKSTGWPRVCCAAPGSPSRCRMSISASRSTAGAGQGGPAPARRQPYPDEGKEGDIAEVVRVIGARPAACLPADAGQAKRAAQDADHNRKGG
jgi:hypothetical protein